MSRYFRLREIEGIPDSIVADMRASYSYPLFLGMECHDRHVTEQLSVTFFYPEPGDLRQRLSTLEADPSPILEAVKNWYSCERVSAEDCARIVSRVLEEMRQFVRYYEEGVAKKTDWRPWMRPITNAADDVTIHMQEEDEANLGQPDDSSIDAGEFDVMFGDPDLMAEQLECVDGDQHRKPYITLW